MLDLVLKYVNLVSQHQSYLDKKFDEMFCADVAWLLEVVVPVPAVLVQVVDVDLQGLREHLVLEFEPELK